MKKEDSSMKWSQGLWRTRDNEQSEGESKSRKATLDRHSSKCLFGEIAKWLCFFQIDSVPNLLLCIMCEGTRSFVFSLFPDQNEPQMNLILR